MRAERIDYFQAVALVLLAFALAIVSVSVVATGGSLATTGVALALGIAAVLMQIRVIPWAFMVGAIVLVILFIPIRRYIIGVEGPFQLEPYRLLLALVLCAWLLALLVDPRVRLRPTGVDGPLALIFLAILGSMAVNGSRVGAMGSDVAKTLIFFASFVLLLYLLASVVRTRAETEVILRVFVGGGVVIAILAVIETRTGFTPFNSLSSYIPLMDLNPSFEPSISRGARVRAFGSAEHPIALGAALAMLIPLSLYLTRIGRPLVWHAATMTLLVGSLATVSRTAVLMLVAMVLFYAAIRPRAVIRKWPLLIVLVIATHALAPGTIGTLREALAPEGGLIAQQRGGAGGTGSGRVADLGPSLEEWAEQPILGQGFGTRVTTGPTANAFILDNQWLGTLLEIGAVGAAAWLWLFVRVIRRSARAARRSRSASGDLAAALGASVTAYAVGMFTFDAFSFIQVTLVLFFVVAFAGTASAQSVEAEAEADVPAFRPSRADQPLPAS